MKNKKELLKIKRHKRITMKVRGTQARPRLIVTRTLRNIFIQVVDDAANKTLFSSSTTDKEIKQKFPYAGNVKASVFFGEVFARRLKEKEIKKIVFDRAGFAYHGRIKAFAESLRKGGIEF